VEITVLVLGVALAGDGCPPAPSGDVAAQAADAYTAGVERVAAGLWAEAEAAFQDALAFDPGIPLAHYGLGQARLALRRYADAAAAFERSREAWLCAASLSDDARRASRRRLDAQLLSLRASLRELDSDRLARSTILWQEVNGDDKPSPGQDARIRDGIERQIAQLERLRDRSAATAPPEIALALGSAWFHAGDLASAEREFRSAAAAESTSGDAHNNLAVVLMLTGRLDEAEQAVRSAESRGVTVDPRLTNELRARRRAAPPR
jgi:Tfp pilus assembly protein PilF